MAGAELAARPGNPPVFSLGPLIHNPQTLASLKERGLVILDEDRVMEQVTNQALPRAEKITADEKPVVIIRAHGINPRTEENLLLKGFRIVDATCPRVKASQNTALTLAGRGFSVFIAGEKNHAEVKSIAGYVEAGAGPRRQTRTGAVKAQAGTDGGRVPACVIVGNAAEAETAAAALRRERPDAETALIAQTTLSADEYERIEAAIKKSFPNLEVKNTICGATRERQDALRKLCAACDAVVIVGGKESANTRRLLAIARHCGKPAWLAETAADLPPELKNYAVAGLCAGASTPDDVVEEIAGALLGE
jgi:4-hydroxy-3-methylbut-2-enyl diphosphate reductase